MDHTLVPEAGNTALRTLELLELHGLGRKRILDTALAATLEEAGVRRLATGNGREYRRFDFLEIIDV